MSNWMFKTTKKKIFLKSAFFFIGSLFRLIDFLWPKHADVIVFGSYLGNYIAGSPKFLYESIKKQHPSRHVVFYCPFRNKNLKKQICSIIRFAPVFFRAKILISSHPPYDFIPFSWSKRKIFINTWHGIPLKCMFFTDPGAKKESLKEVLWLNDRTTVFLVSSSLEAALISRCFNLDSRKIAFFGHPRNDILKSGKITSYLNKIFPDLPDHTTRILYCPTYRRNGSVLFFPFEDMDIQYLNQFLEKNKIIIFTRGHVQENSIQTITNNSRIIELGQDLLPEINDILPEIDILITDYSSIFFDFLLCNKPCIFIPYDKEDYKNSVGFLFDDYDYWTPGKKVTRFGEFIKTIEEILSGEDKFKEKREEMINLFHFYQTENSSEKIFNFLDAICHGDKK